MTDSDQNAAPEKDTTKNGFNNMSLGAGIGAGVAIGVAIGVAMDNIGMGIAIGIALGIAMGGAFNVSRSRNGDND